MPDEYHSFVSLPSWSDPLGNRCAVCYVDYDKHPHIKPKIGRELNVKPQPKHPYYMLSNDTDVIQAAFNDGEGVEYSRWTIIAYLVRAGKKEGNSVIDDLTKALDHLTRWLEYEKMLQQNS